MSIVRTKFHKDTITTEVVDSTKHPGLEVFKPLTISQMLHRAANGQPISVRKFGEDQIKFNGRFYNGEKLDVYDSILKEQKRLKSRGAVNTLSSTAPADTFEGGSTQNTPQNITDETKQSGV